MKSISATILLCGALGLVGGCSQDDGFDRAAYEAEIVEWREGRLERLKGPTGYLNLAGLFWLQDATSTLGSADDNDIVLPASTAARIGKLQLTDGGVELVVDEGVEVRHNDRVVQSVLMADDTTASPVTVTHGSLAWTVIKRDDRYAVRLRDYEHPAIAAFPPIEYYPIDPGLRLNATLHRLAEPRELNLNTVVEGLGWRPESPGSVVFELEGEQFELEAYASGDQLFFVFGDRTSGRETYPAGRFLYAALPGDDGVTILDFNKAYNPPCAFNDFATCPVASPRNRLAARIEAGEKFDAAVHFTPEPH